MIDPRELEAEIPAEWFMFASSEDHQQSNEVYNVGNTMNLPDPNGREGGACTAAFLQACYRDDRDTLVDLSYVGVLRKMRDAMDELGFKDQNPQLSCSREIDVNKTMHVVPPGSVGNKRALLVGINYEGQKGALKACHNDVNNVKDFLVDLHGFQERDILCLMDDGNHKMPTKKNIETGFRLLTSRSKPGDVVFVMYSGHGGQQADEDGDEEDGFDETLIPVDFDKSGHIIDDDILKILVKPMRHDVHCTVIMDCCHSGTVLDLPYLCGPDHDSMQLETDYKVQPTYNTLIERIQHNDKTLVELALDNPEEWPAGEQYDELCGALGNNWTIEAMYLNNFLDAYNEEQKDQLFAAIGKMEELSEIHIDGVKGVSFQQLEPMVVSSRNLRVLKFAATQFNNNGQDYKQFVELLREHPKVKKYNFDRCFFADKKEQPPYVPKFHKHK